MLRGFRRLELTGDTLASPRFLAESLSSIFFTASQLGWVRTVLGLPLWVSPGEDLEFKLCTVPILYCFPQIFLSWFFDGILTPGNLIWKSCIIRSLKLSDPPGPPPSMLPRLRPRRPLGPSSSFLLWYSRAMKFLCSTVYCGRGTILYYWWYPRLFQCNMPRWVPLAILQYLEIFPLVLTIFHTTIHSSFHPQKTASTQQFPHRLVTSLPLPKPSRCRQSCKTFPHSDNCPY